MTGIRPTTEQDMRAGSARQPAQGAPLGARTPSEAGRARPPRVVIGGAGFGGLNAARTLAGKGVNVLVLDRNNYHGFWPLLYQVATAGLEPESIAYPVRAIFRKHPNIHFQMAEVHSVDLERRVVHTRNGAYTYDYLILAAGSANNYFGNTELARHTFGLKDIDEAEHIRNHLLTAFELALKEPDPARRRELMTFAIVGGGPTGVEMAGAISELVYHVLRKDYPELDVTQTRIVLIEAGDSLLAAFPEGLRNSAKRQLERMHVEVRLNAPVQSVENGLVTFKDGSTLRAALVIWAAGVRASSLTDGLGVPLGKQARIRVQPALNLPDHPEVFAVGDMAYLEGYRDGQPFPMVAQVAIQQGKHAARNILADVQGKPMTPFRYFDQGTMATIGRRFAVFDAFGIQLSGFIAWLGWLLVHIVYLIGFRNRLIVLANWVVNYFTFDRGVRLITERVKKIYAPDLP